MKNQILQTSKNNNKKIKFLKWQIFMSLLGIIASIILFKKYQNNNLEFKNYSKNLAQSMVLSSIYQTENTAINNNIFCLLEIPSLNINYAVFNEYNEDLLKISLCKFAGTNINESRKYSNCSVIIMMTTLFLVT